MITEETIRRIVKETIAELRASHMLTESGKTDYEKTEDLLRNYNYFLSSGKPELLRIIQEIDEAMKAISDDSYYPLLIMYYFSGDTREDIADYFGTSTTTISRQKRRLVEKLSRILFVKSRGTE